MTVLKPHKNRHDRTKCTIFPFYILIFAVLPRLESRTLRFSTNPKNLSEVTAVKTLLPKFHRADSALRPQAAGGVGVCASVGFPNSLKENGMKTQPIPTSCGVLKTSKWLTSATAGCRVELEVREMPRALVAWNRLVADILIEPSHGISIGTPVAYCNAHLIPGFDVPSSTRSVIMY